MQNCGTPAASYRPSLMSSDTVAAWANSVIMNRDRKPGRMKAVSLSLLFLWAAAPPGQQIKQEITRSEPPPGVSIRRYKWQQVGPGPSVDQSWKAESDSTSGSTTSSEDSPSFAERRGPFFVYSLEIQNDGGKPIKAIRWNYIIFDTKTNEELGTHEFETFERVGLSKSRSLTAKSRLTPTRVVPIQVTDKSATTEQVVIKCVVYEDGTMWQAGGMTAPVCEALRQRARK